MKIHQIPGDVTVYEGDWIESLRSMPSESVQCVPTSPPYYGLRDYGHEDQLGMEKTPEEYVAKLIEGFREVRRVLRDDGTLWLNLGDSYTSRTKGSGGKGKSTLHGTSDVNYAPRTFCTAGYKDKDLMGIPWMVAFALRADGWYLRQDIIWHKPNPMPESVQDRCTKAHEYMFLLTKSSRYYYDCDAIAEDAIGGLAGNHNHKGTAAYNHGQAEHRTKAGLLNYAQKQRANVRPQMEAALRKGREGGLTQEHYAAIRAAGMTDSGKAQETQTGFGKNTVRILELAAEAKHVLGGYYREFLSGEKRNKRSVWTVPSAPYADAHFATFPPKLIEPCILAGCPQGGVVLDPFGGSGTTAEVARAFGRKSILCELNPDYIELIKKRLDSKQTRLTDFIDQEPAPQPKEIPLFS